MRKCPFCAADIADDAARCDSCDRLLPAETTAVSMPLCYTHTCDRCGSSMTVFDRSYWKTIECESCGQPFLGSPPTTEEFGEAIAVPRRKRRMLVLGIGGLIVIVCIALAIVAWLR